MPMSNVPSDYHLKVSPHPSGRLTLMQSHKGAVYTDVDGALGANLDQAEFYRAAFRYAAQLLEAGHTVRITDQHL